MRVYARIYARMYARAYDCQDSTSDTRRTRPPERGGTQNKFHYCGEIYTQKTKKVKKKFVNNEKSSNFAQETTK